MKFFGGCNISRTFGFYNTLINRQKALKGVLSMSVLQTIDLKKYYGTEPNITRALDGVNFPKFIKHGLLNSCYSNKYVSKNWKIRR